MTAPRSVRPLSRRAWHFTVNSSSSNGATGSANAAPFTPSAPNQRVVGQVPQNWHSGSGTIITGAAANKAKSIALATYPGGTVNRVLKLSDGYKKKLPIASVETSSGA